MGKLEKTDQTGKTVEAWYALLFAEGSLGQSIFRWGWPVIGGAAGGWVAYGTDWISSYGLAGWAATIMLGALGFVWLAVGIDSFRSRRFASRSHLPPAELDYQPTAPDRGGHVTPEQLSSVIETLLNEKLPARFASHADIHCVDERLSELAEKVKSARQIAESGHADTDFRISSLVERLGSIQRDLDAWTREHCNDQDQRFRNVDGGFRAIRDRETLEKLANKIRVQADGLLRTSRGDRVDNWGVWNSQNLQWQQDITAYCRMAGHYLADVPGLIEHVPSHRLQGGWPEERDLFPSDDAVIAHRTAAVKMQNFEQQHERVMACVTSFAFESPSMKGISNS